jgi:glycosyltransferase involved in cell wall biosynthesis
MKSGDVEIWICTHNPNLDLIRTAIDSAIRERRNYGALEISLVDNNSKPELSRVLEKLCKDNGIFYYFVEAPGIAEARYFACTKFDADYLIFLDDDNVFNENYVSGAVDFFEKNLDVGALGGKAFFPHSISLPVWKVKLLPYLGIRDSFGEIPLTGVGPEWGVYEPIGAGSVLHKSVVKHFRELDLTKAGYFNLGRVGRGYLSGEDSFIVRQSYAIGRKCVYLPTISIQHHINLDRLSFSRLTKLLFSYGVSDVFLDKSLSKHPDYPYPKNLFEISLRLVYMLKTHGFSGLFLWLRHVGQYVGNRSLSA